MRGREESLPELAEDIERLVRLAYPDAAEPMVEVLSKDQFVDALPEEDMRLRIRQNKPATLRDALAVALELESYRLASRQKARYVREAQVEGPLMQRQMVEAKAKDSAADVLQQLVDALNRCAKEPGKLPTAGRKARNRTDGVAIVCWECRERGHRR